MANPPRTPTPPPAARTGPPAPLGAVLPFTFLNSLGTGAVQTGVFFILQSAFGYGRLENYAFGLLLYGSYVAGALAAGPALRRLARAHEAISTRAVLIAVLAGQAVCSLIPRGVALIVGEPLPPEWTLWVVAVGFGVLTGVMWPIVESYLSGARTGRALSSATGLFNVVWSGSVLAAFWLMAPLLESRPLDVILALGMVQITSVVFILPLRREPGRHLPHEHEPHPGSWVHLLSIFRVLLPLSYVVSGTLSPLLPTSLEQMGIRELWRPPIASAWLVSRVVVFFVFERWPGWHGRTWMPLVAGVLLLGGFAGAIVAPRFGEYSTIVMIATLTVFGAGHAMIYLGALYYAMEVGRAEVDAGGVHEALIGLGYALGPVIGLTVLLLGGARSGVPFETWLIVAVVLVSGVAGTLIWRSGKRANRTKSNHKSG